MKNLRQLFPLLSVIILIASCQSQVEQVRVDPTNKFVDNYIVEIYDLVDKRNGDSLLTFLRHENETYRYEAALGFGSIQDTAAIVPLSFSLQDTSPKVRRAAAYALGQIGDSSAIKPIAEALEVEDSVFVRKEMLESLGKVVTQDSLSLLQYWPLKTQEDKEGLAWGLYRAGIRNVHDGISIDMALSLLDSSNSYLTRLGAAHFLYRSKNLDLKGRTSLLKRAALNDASAYVRMACVLALGNAVEDSSLKALKLTVKDTDYRVRVNSVRALGSFPAPGIYNELIGCLNDENFHVSIAAASALANKVSAENYDELELQLDKNLNWRVKAAVYGILLSLTEEKQELLSAIKNEYGNAKNSYYKAALLQALGNTVTSHEFLITKLFSETEPPITTAALSSLINVRMNEDFPDELKPAFANVFKEAILTGDVALIALSSNVLTVPELKFKEEYDSVNFLYVAKNKLDLPKDMEALQSLERTIHYFEDNEYVAPTNDYNHPINWELVQSIDKSAKAIINTVKGSITVALKIENAPSSVANFVYLSKRGYYDGKVFHRVVPNFVAQGGCGRGDGFGSEDYSIRSEFANMRYEEGTVGMASSGKDTEGTQWFITHSPTPHLDGAYTIFAQVIDGMNTVHQLEVGDTIKSIEIE